MGGVLGIDFQVNTMSFYTVDYYTTYYFLTMHNL